MIYNPTVSVIIPVYKTENFICRCIDSVRRQSYKNLEIILIDDGSPDRCGEICDDYEKKDERIRVFHQENQGLSGARNAGIKHSTGEWIYFLDSDDYISSAAIEKMVETAEAGKYDIVVAGYSIVKIGKKIVDCSTNWQRTDDLAEIRRKIILDELPNFACGKLYKKELWKNIRFPLNQLVEDMQVNGKLFFKAGSACVIPDSLYFYSRENENSLSRGKDVFNFVKMKYGRFLGWKKHAEIAGQYMPSCEKLCREKAIIHGIKALVVNAGTDILEKSAVDDIKKYILENRKIKLPFAPTVQRNMMIRNHQLLLNAWGCVKRSFFLWKCQIRKNKKD